MTPTTSMPMPMLTTSTLDTVIAVLLELRAEHGGETPLTVTVGESHCDVNNIYIVKGHKLFGDTHTVVLEVNPDPE